ncbi:hypothetical protein [Streptomyces sp. NWU49]|uniref:hypothetical protein n=1 Tax=Streptomyces sp. NWU49 TaxID=2201153 RepID=UPI0015E7ED3C|nr:hypothetical protein [Streptomyces sp. NWU49]
MRRNAAIVAASCGGGEAQQGRLGSGTVVVLPVLAVLVAGPDDPPVLVTLEVDLALPAGAGAGSELLDRALVV